MPEAVINNQQFIKNQLEKGKLYVLATPIEDASLS